MQEKKRARAGWVVCGLLLLLSCGSAVAQSLIEAYRLARDNDPKWRAAGFEQQATNEAKAQARAALLPLIGFDAEKIETDQNIISSNNPVFALGASRYSTENQLLTIRQPIFRLASWIRLQQADAVVRQAAATHAAAEQDLILRVANAFLGVLAAQDALTLATAEKESVAKQRDLAQGRFERGLGTMTNLYDARARYAFNEAREIEATYKLKDAGQALREVTGKVFEAPRPLRDTIPLTPPDPSSVEQWVEIAEKQNWRLEARRLGAEVAREEVKRQRAGHVPTLDLVGTNNYRRSGGTVFGGGANTETRDVTLRLNIPIFEGGNTTSLTREAAYRSSKAVEDVEFEWRQLERQTRAAFLGVVSGIGLVTALSNTVEAQEKAVEAKNTGLQAGLFTLLPVLDAQRDLFLAKRDYAQARYDYLINRLRLKEAAGTLSEDDLVAINMMLQ